MMLLFSVWEGRNGARPESSNTVACRARRVGHAGATSSGSPSGTASSRAHAGRIALCGGSDDHGALDIATTCTEAAGATRRRSSWPPSRPARASRAASTARA